MFRICKKFSFEAAHQLDKAFSQECVECIHGHSYVVELFLVSESLDDMDMVLDFGYLKELIKDIKKKYDHSLILQKGWKEDYEEMINNHSLQKVVSQKKIPRQKFLQGTFIIKWKNG